MIERFLTMEKTKEYLGCKDNRTAIKLLQKASIPPTKVGKRFKIDRFAIDDYYSKRIEANKGEINLKVENILARV